jgi:capsule polysaccharide export protein KpsE/RkpR
MATTQFDTISVIKELKAGGFTSKQAEAQAKVIFYALKQAEDARFSELATKKDLKDVEIKIKELEVKISDAKAETIKWVAGMLLVQAGILIGGFFAIVRFLLQA